MLGKQPFFNVVSTSVFNVETTLDFHVETTSYFNVGTTSFFNVETTSYFNVETTSYFNVISTLFQRHISTLKQRHISTLKQHWTSTLKRHSVLLYFLSLYMNYVLKRLFKIHEKKCKNMGVYTNCHWHNYLLAKALEGGGCEGEWVFRALPCGTTQATVLDRSLSNFTCKLWMMRRGTLLLLGSLAQRSGSALVLGV